METKTRRIRSVLLDVFCSEQCALCGRSSSWSDDGVCPRCQGALSEQLRSEPVFDIHDHTMIYFDSSYALYDYSGPVRELVKGFKYRGRTDILRGQGQKIAAGLGYHGRDCIIVPVPMARSRRKKRGYNQAKVLAGHLAREMKLEMCDILTATEQKEQKHAHYLERFVQTLGRYSLKEGISVTKKTILLIDDVATTGATLNECSRILKNAGAERIIAVVMAAVPQKQCLYSRAEDSVA